MSPRLPCPTEHDEQCAVLEWSRAASGKHPELALLYAIPNAGKRSKRMGGRMKAEGMKAGVPDLCLPVARFGFHGLYLELKRREGGRMTPEQSAWLCALAEQGYMAVCVRGAEAAIRTLHDYVRAEGKAAA